MTPYSLVYFKVLRKNILPPFSNLSTLIMPDEKTCSDTDAAGYSEILVNVHRTARPYILPQCFSIGGTGTIGGTRRVVCW